MKKLLTPLLISTLFSPLYADQVIVDDLIVQGSECVGIDCVNGESFGFDTLRLKENNLRIGFDDTSASAGFPSNDWQITINDSASGGANKFSIDDITGAKTPFTVEAGAPSHSLYVENTGDVGLGTIAPVVDLHIVEGDSPTVRLEQDGSSGFTPQTWDVAGNETNFFVRDVTNGSKLPFKIRPGAPDNSIYINTNGNIGLGTASPTSKLHVQNGDISAIYAVSNDLNMQNALNASATNSNTAKKSDVGITLQNARENFAWQLRTWEPDSSFSISKENSGGKELIITGTDTAGGMELILGNGAKNSGGNWINASSRDLKENIEELSTEEALQAFHALKPVSYNYKTDKTEQVLGFIAEDVPDIVAINGRDGISSMDLVALLTKVVQEQDNQLENMKAEIEKLKLMQKK